jgi:hypothetical protein
MIFTIFAVNQAPSSRCGVWPSARLGQARSPPGKARARTLLPNYPDFVPTTAPCTRHASAGINKLSSSLVETTGVHRIQVNSHWRKTVGGRRPSDHLARLARIPLGSNFISEIFAKERNVNPASDSKWLLVLEFVVPYTCGIIVR